MCCSLDSVLYFLHNHIGQQRCKTVDRIRGRVKKGSPFPLWSSWDLWFKRRGRSFRGPGAGSIPLRSFSYSSSVYIYVWAGTLYFAKGYSTLGSVLALTQCDSFNPSGRALFSNERHSLHRDVTSRYQKSHGEIITYQRPTLPSDSFGFCLNFGFALNDGIPVPISA